VEGQRRALRCLIPLDEDALIGATTANPASFRLRVTSSGESIFAASADRDFPIWTKQSRCPDCSYGNAFVTLNADGSVVDGRSS